MRFPTQKSRLVLIGAAATAVAVACTQIPIPLPFQAQAVATPQAGATPGAGQKPQGQGQAQTPGKPGGAGVPVVTAPATQGKISASLAFSGTITPVQQTNLVPKTAGRIEKITVEVGDKVKQGQMLIQLDRGAMDAAISQAQANLETAKARLATVQAGARPEDVASAQAALASARARLGGLESGGRVEDIANAEAALTSARARLTQTQNGAREADLRVAEQAIAAAQASFDATIASYNKLSTPSPEELASAKAALDKAQAALQQAQANYDRVGWRPDIAGRPESVALQAATADYQNALAQLKLRQQPRGEDLETSKKQMDAARAQLDAAKARLDQLKAGPTTEDLQIAQAAVTQAEQNLAKARSPSTSADIEVQRQTVVQAEQTVSLRSQPFTQNDVATAQAAVAQAQAQLDNAKVSSIEGSIVAPYDGVITARPLAEGALTNAGTPSIAIASVNAEVVANVEEGRIGELKPGQAATITVPAYPGVVFPAKVASIAPMADSRTHTFPVKVRPEPMDPRLFAGMFAEVKITTREKDSAVLVPKDAVVQRAGKTQIYVVEDGRAKALDVAGGMSDDKSIEVPAGLKSGDPVIVQGQSTVNDGDAVRTGGGAGAGQGGAPGKPQGGAGAKPDGAAGAKPEGAAGTKPEGAAGKPQGAGKPEGAGAKPEGAAGAKPEGAASAAATPAAKP
jgi:HlyD family secretion protein